MWITLGLTHLKDTYGYLGLTHLKDTDVYEVRNNKATYTRTPNQWRSGARVVCS